MYCGDILLKNLKMFTHMHCATLSLVGSQFYFNKFIYTYIGPVIKIQTISDAFILRCLDLLDSLLFKDGYQAGQA